ncbi:hypothetical protein HELRODRAFT_188882 [Helobdella robusta]|uniref:ILEI/PANDER domain-containing protein n=1 Tax=Helobdella robusta TaxID=6412 RepID=T1FQF5_HELRO|nr:hypothetical protein HELRODRAFT_188882 [Helobdella robusta]ESN98692.1 hypothetical protein HELRODRAFT_188882 [Helobdella robusta]
MDINTDDSISYHIRSGEGKDSKPNICFNGEYLINAEQDNAKRGINMVVINEKIQMSNNLFTFNFFIDSDKTLEVEDIRYFDTYESDVFLKHYLKMGIQNTQLVLVATFDDAGLNLSNESRILLASYGSALIQNLKFRDNFVALGQRGLAKGSSIEKLTAREKDAEFAKVAEVKGCVRLPVGKLNQLPNEQQTEQASPQKVSEGEGLINCGVPKPCEPGSISLHMYTGKENVDVCKLCINGRYVFAKNLNHAGRGLNIAVVSPKTQDVIKIGNFDTFSADSTNAELFLEMLEERDIIVVVSNDEASSNLNVNIQRQFEELGSRMISKLSFRDVWVFVGQKGIVGKSPFEQLNRAEGSWPKPIDLRMCIPMKIQGNLTLQPKDVIELKKKFCSKYSTIVDDDFCSHENLKRLIEPAHLLQSEMVNNDVFKLPIIIIPGNNYKSFQLQIEALLANPGIDPKKITVIYSRSNGLYADLSEVYGARSHSMVPLDDSYKNFLIQAISRAWKIHPYEKNMIFLEDEVIPSLDFLSFIGRCMTTNFLVDSTLFGISAWTPYREGHGITSLWYRSNHLPGLGFLMKKSFYMDHLNDHLSTCCLNRTWFGWKAVDIQDNEMIYPDAPRVFRLPYIEKPKSTGEKTETNDLSIALFAAEPNTNDDSNAELDQPGMMIIHRYETYLRELIKKSKPLDQKFVDTCVLNNTVDPKLLPERKIEYDNLNAYYIIYYDQKTADDFSGAFKIASCFKFKPLPGVPNPNFRRGLLRLSYKEDHIMIVGSKTEYYEYKSDQSEINTIP